MALSPEAKSYAQSIAHQHALQGLIAIMIKLHPNEDIVTALRDYLKIEADKVVASPGVDDAILREFKGEVLRTGDQIAGRGHNASI